MILHATSLAVLLLDQIPQVPIAVQCVQQAASKADWKWWMSALAPWLGPIISMAGSIYVASRVFRWQGGKDRKQWLLDQKKIDWKELLKKASEIHRILPVSSAPITERAPLIADQLKPSIRELSELQLSCVFLADFFKSREKRETFFMFMKEAEEAADAIDGLLALPATIDLSQDENQNRIRDLMTKVREVTAKYLHFMAWLRSAALEDLEVNSPDVPLAPMPRESTS